MGNLFGPPAACLCYPQHYQKCFYKDINQCQIYHCGYCGKEYNGNQHSHVASCCGLVLDPCRNIQHRNGLHDCKCLKCDNVEEFKNVPIIMTGASVTAGLRCQLNPLTQERRQRRRLCHECNSKTCQYCNKRGEVNTWHICKCLNCFNQPINLNFGDSNKVFNLASTSAPASTLTSIPKKYLCHDCKQIETCKYCGKLGKIGELHSCICQTCRLETKNSLLNNNNLAMIPRCPNCSQLKMQQDHQLN